MPECPNREPLGARTRWRAGVAVAGAAAIACGLLAAVPAAATGSADTQVVSGEAFLSNGIAEVGSRANGSFGSTNAAPSGYHPLTTQPDAILGFMADRDKDGWGVGTDDGDFFTPGRPLEAWGLQVGSATTLWNRDNLTDIPGAHSSPTTSGGTAGATWTATAPAAGIGVTQVTTVAPDQQRIDVAVTLTNTTASPIANIYYGRALDPDNCRMSQVTNGCDSDGDGVADSTGGTFKTWSEVLSQKRSGDPVSVVSATQTDGTYLDLRSREAGSVVATGLFPSLCTPTVLSTVFAATPTSGNCSLDATVGAEHFVDDMMYLVIKTAALAAGSSRTMRFSYVLTEAQAASQPNEPGAPRSVTATPGDRSSVVSFLPPVSDGGSVVTGYQVSLDGGRTWLTLNTGSAGGGRLTATVTGLLNGIRYPVKVRAVNAVGAGPSAAATPVLPNSAKPTRVDRSDQIAVPSRPGRHRGRAAYTRARWATYGGRDAPASSTLGWHQLVVGEAATLADRGLFGFESAKLTPAGKAEVRRLAAHLRIANKVTCEGYTDYAGDRRHELALSRKRAAAVCAALKAAGADVTVVARGYGRARPAVVGGTPRSRAENRRVVVVVKS